MFCENCGKENISGAKFCEGCGTPLTVTEPVVAPLEPVGAGNKVTPIIVALIAIVVVAGLIFGGISLFGGNKFMKPMNNLIKSLEKEDADFFLKAIPEEFADELDREDLKELEKAYEIGNEILEDEYGKNVKIKAKVVDKEKLDDDDIEDLEGTFVADLDVDDIDEAYEVEYKVTVKGKKDKEEAKWETYVAKIDGKWYFIDMDDLPELVVEFIDMAEIQRELYDGAYASAY